MSERRLKRSADDMDDVALGTSHQCCVCNTYLFHYGYEPINMGCQCTGKICTWCVKLGNVTNCPTCRKYRRRPSTDEKWLKRQLQRFSNKETATVDTLECTGCGEAIELSKLIVHERQCTAYRDYLDTVRLEHFVENRDRANQYEVNIREMNDRLELQEEEIEELDETCSNYKVMLAAYEAEKRVYAFEQQNTLTALNKLAKPITTLFKKFNEIQGVINNLKDQVRESKENHKDLWVKRRRLGIDPETVLGSSVEDGEIGPSDTDSDYEPEDVQEQEHTCDDECEECNGVRITRAHVHVVDVESN